MSFSNLEISQFACPACTSTLRLSKQNMLCVGCKCAYPVVLGVPLLLQNGKWQSIRKVAPGKAEKLLELLALPRTADTIAVAGDILGGRLDHPSGYLSTESSQFVSRVKSSLPTTWPVELDTLIPSSNINAITNVNRFDEVSFEWTASYLPENLPLKATSSANFRLKNTGKTCISSKGGRPIVASGHWISETGAEETLRTKLLIDLPANAELTFPILFQTPTTAGNYRFRPSLLIEGTGWILGKQEFPVYVHAHLHAHTPFPQHPTKSSYNDDHHAAISLLKDWSREFKNNPVAVELGGNFSPSFGTVFSKFLNIDIDLPGLQFAAIRNDGVTNICADGLALPLADQSIDIVGIFATLHHFPDPVNLLRHIRKKLKPTGRVALMCEPVGHVFLESMYEEYLSELLKGVNEQSFSEEEYVAIFEQSGFRVRNAVMHGSSLKAWLEPIH
jgi:uncharacterized protein YbaR (Trm112 family)